MKNYTDSNIERISQHSSFSMLEVAVVMVQPQPSAPKSNTSLVSVGVNSYLTSSIFSPLDRVKELTVDPNQVTEGGRPNIPTRERDDLKLLCEQIVSALFTCSWGTLLLKGSHCLTQVIVC